MAYVSPRWASGPRVRRTETAKGLPVIDVGALFSESRRAHLEVAERIGRAARTVGMFYISGHGIDASLQDRVVAQAARFFALPEDAKLAYHIARSENHRGYVPFSEKGDYADEGGDRLYEAFDSALELPADDPAARASPLMGPNVWPAGLPGFRDAVTEYYRSVSGVAQAVTRAFELYLGVEDGYFSRFMRTPASQLRVLHYVENEAPSYEEQQSMGAHTDYECFTLLHQTAPGLQSMTVDREWVDVPPIEGTLVVNIGDMMEVWSNGIFVSNPHRVLNTGRERYSMPFFQAADPDAVIEPVPTAVSRARPSAYEPVVAGEHLLTQLLRDFPYLRTRGDIVPCRTTDGAAYVNPFEQSKMAAASALGQAA